MSNLNESVGDRLLYNLKYTFRYIKTKLLRPNKSVYNTCNKTCQGEPVLDR